MKKLVPSTLLCLALLGGTALAKEPVRNVSAKRHPNIAAAQRLVGQAYDKVEAAQKANEFDLGGHAQKAKELLEQANQELKLAAEVANEKAR
jgi:F0F1-type ATP synthase membrane subunit b/b'